MQLFDKYTMYDLLYCLYIYDWKNIDSKLDRDLHIIKSCKLLSYSDFKDVPRIFKIIPNYKGIQDQFLEDKFYEDDIESWDTFQQKLIQSIMFNVKQNENLKKT